ncbi:MAG: amino acid permease [Gemmatimonadetes bacterium]|nr:amino acid permease [Gemmatimonadota bacterium]
MTATARPGELRRVMRIRDGLAVTVGIVIGAGILRTPGLIAGYLGSAWPILAVWVAGSVVAGLSTLVLAEMASALPEAGGKYVYAREAWGPVMGFVAGWSELLVTRGFSGASKAVVIAEYVRLLAGRGNVSILAGAVVLGFFFLHTRGLKASTVFQNVTTAVKVLVILVIAAAGIWAGDMAGFKGGEIATTGSKLGGLALAYLAVSFACYGWEDAAKMAEEVRDPGRALPRILVGGAVAVGVLYLLMNVSFLAALTPAQMAGSKLVASDAIAGVFGHAAGTVVVWASLLILVSSLNVNFLGMPRVAYGLARNGLAIRSFKHVDPRGTPNKALWFISAWIGVLAVTGSFAKLIDYMMMVAIPVDCMVLLGYFRLRMTRPDLERPFRVPGHPWVAGLTIVLYLAIVAILVGTQPHLALGGGAMITAMVVAGVIVARRRPAAASPPGA